MIITNQPDIKDQWAILAFVLMLRWPFCLFYWNLSWCEIKKNRECCRIWHDASWNMSSDQHLQNKGIWSHVLDLCIIYGDNMLRSKFCRFRQIRLFAIFIMSIVILSWYQMTLLIEEQTIQWPNRTRDNDHKSSKRKPEFI
jgi:hypothetical protein